MVEHSYKKFIFFSGFQIKSDSSAYIPWLSPLANWSKRISPLWWPYLDTYFWQTEFPVLAAAGSWSVSSASSVFYSSFPRHLHPDHLLPEFLRIRPHSSPHCYSRNCLPNPLRKCCCCYDSLGPSPLLCRNRCYPCYRVRGLRSRRFVPQCSALHSWIPWVHLSHKEQR